MPLQPLTLRRRRRAALAGLLTAVLLAGACGGDDDEAVAEATTTVAAEVTTTTSTPPTTAPPTTVTTGPPATTTTKAAAAPTGAILVQGFAFKPPSLAVKPGTVVTWTNKDAIQHTATSGTSVESGGLYTGTADGKFDGDMPEQGKAFSFTFSTAGTYKYFCSRHNNMVGEVVVS